VSGSFILSKLGFFICIHDFSYSLGFGYNFSANSEARAEKGQRRNITIHITSDVTTEERRVNSEEQFSPFSSWFVTIHITSDITNKKRGADDTTYNTTLELTLKMKRWSRLSYIKGNEKMKSDAYIPAEGKIVAGF
jgi:hypothetical protein